MDNMKSEILKKYLNNDVKKWEMAGEIYNYHCRKRLLSDIKKTMIDDFLEEDEENQKYAKEVSENFPELVDERYKAVSKRIGEVFKEKFPEIQKINPTLYRNINPYTPYEYNHYIDLILKNGIRIQLKYSHYFRLIEINYPENIKIQFSYNFGVKSDDFYKFLVDENEISRVCLEHDNNVELNNIIKGLIGKLA